MFASGQGGYPDHERLRSENERSGSCTFSQRIALAPRNGGSGNGSSCGHRDPHQGRIGPSASPFSASCNLSVPLLRCFGRVSFLTPLQKPLKRLLGLLVSSRLANRRRCEEALIPCKRELPFESGGCCPLRCLRNFNSMQCTKPQRAAVAQRAMQGAGGSGRGRREQTRPEQLAGHAVEADRA